MEGYPVVVRERSQGYQTTAILHVGQEMGKGRGSKGSVENGFSKEHARNDRRPDGFHVVVQSAVGFFEGSSSASEKNDQGGNHGVGQSHSISGAGAADER
jgi:hypothetical protein